MSNQQISRLYDTVHRNDVLSNGVTMADIKAAIEDMKEVYMPRPHSLYSTEKPIADYNTVAHRCAYLYKYAPLHSAIVRDELKIILNQSIFWKFHDKLATSKLKICSLGGGPGSDIVGIVAALSELDVFQCSAKVVDLKADWEDTLRSVVQELRSGDYGVVGQCFQAENFDWDYLTADLLEDEIKGDVFEAVGEADLVTMVKFVSAASCQSTYSMLKKIFRMLKPGSMVLFIDNASGGFSELVDKVSKESQGFETNNTDFVDCTNGLVAQGFETNNTDFVDCTNGLVAQGFETNNTDFVDCTNGLVAQGFETNNTDFVDCTNGLVAQGFVENVSDVAACTNAFNVGKVNRYQLQSGSPHQPQSASVEIEVEKELESQVNCCSSCVIS
ncbi:hypothetical protein JTE90_023982 [Oedothorax gibbosus]|uniref:Uncharacterized protein n=1 Tax=Oedothorax gibbosus TaxID=931172 RepID=A0AAV6UHV5_9ARAC|nr:hypothetical protein JTE90_023982 [Oedothorax gibbosus]